MQYNTFNYDNPIAFAKENVVYILVVSEEKNIVDADKMRKCLLAGQKFQSDYMRKLEKYILKKHIFILLNYWKIILLSILNIRNHW